MSVTAQMEGRRLKFFDGKWHVKTGRNTWAELEQPGMITLGNKARDKISGLEGIVTARTEFLHGCVRLQIQAKANKKEGKVPNGYWVDEPQCQNLGAVHKKATKPAHGQRPDAQRQAGTPR